MQHLGLDTSSPFKTRTAPIMCGGSSTNEDPGEKESNSPQRNHSQRGYNDPFLPGCCPCVEDASIEKDNAELDQA